MNFTGTQRTSAKYDDSKFDFFCNTRKEATVWVKKINGIIRASTGNMKKFDQNNILKELAVNDLLNLNI